MKTHEHKDYPYKNLFIDLDRTLWHFEFNARQTLSDIYRKHNLAESFENFTSFHVIYKKHNEKLWELYRNNKIDKETVSWKRFYLTLKDAGIENESLAKEIGKDYIEISPTKMKLFPGAIPVLTYLKKHYNLYLITNGFREVQLQKINNCGLRRFFIKIFTSDDIGIHKPNIEFFEKVIELSKANKEESLVIGDDLIVDIEGAMKAGIDQVWFNNRNLFENETNITPSIEINRLTDLIHVL